MVDESISKQKEPQQVQRWLDRISVSKRWRDQVSADAHWERFLEQLKGHYDVKLGNTYVPPINEMFAYKDAMLANLYYKDPYLAVNAKKDATIASAYILEAGVNHLWKELGLKNDIELEITDTEFIGHGWNKVGSNVKTTGSGDQLQLVEDRVYANRVSWRDMFMNVGCKRPTKDNIWIAQRIYKPTLEVKEEYGRRASTLKGSVYPGIDDKHFKSVAFKEDFSYSAIYEIWDAKERKIFTLCDELTTKYLEDPKPWPEYLKEFPFQFLSFHEIPDEPYPQSSVGQFEPQVLEKIKLFTQMLNHIKRWNRQLVAKKGTMNSQELDKFEKGIDGAILLASTQGDIQSAFKLLDYGQLPPDIYMALDRIDAVIRKINGMPEFNYGGVTKTSTRTDGELDKIERGSDARMDRKQDRVETHCENIARHLIFQMKNNFQIPYIANITGKEPPEIIEAFKQQGIYDPVSKTITFTAKNIKGEFDVDVKAGSTLPLNKQTRDQILDRVMETGVQIASAGSLPPFLAEVMKERLKDFDIKALEVAFEDQQRQQAEQNAQKESSEDVTIQKTKAEARKRDAQATDIQLDSLIKGVQATGKATGDLPAEVSLTK